MSLILICKVSLLVVLSIGAVSTENTTLAHRPKRGLAYPTNSCSGVLFAIAVPLKIPNRNIFMSYNFEANYNMPTSSSDIVPGPLDRLKLVDGRQLSDAADTERRSRTKTKRNIFTRAKFYNFITRKLNSLDLNGKACLLKLICETSSYSLKDHNGVLGDLIHVLLSPSSSHPESIHREYYKAEAQGRLDDCRRYDRLCPEDIMEIITNVS